MNKKKKHKLSSDGIVYSTDAHFEFSSDENPDSDVDPRDMDLRIFLDRKAGGKLLSRVSGFTGSDAQLNELEKSLKKLCGTGGSSKDGEILIQGDFRDKILAHLIQGGYRAKKAGG